MVALWPVASVLFLAVVIAHMVNHIVVRHHSSALISAASHLHAPELELLEELSPFHVLLAVARARLENMRVAALELLAGVVVLAVLEDAVGAQDQLAFVAVTDRPLIRQRDRETDRAHVDIICDLLIIEIQIVNVEWIRHLDLLILFVGDVEGLEFGREVILDFRDGFL